MARRLLQYEGKYFYMKPMPLGGSRIQKYRSLSMQDLYRIMQYFQSPKYLYFTLKVCW